MKKKNDMFYEKLIDEKKVFFKISNLLRLRNKFISKIRNNNFYNYNKIYIFGFGVIGRIVFHVLKKNNVKIDGFIDNDKNLLNSAYLGLKILGPMILNNLINRKAKNILVIICQNEKKVSNQITRQLKNIGQNNINIKIF